VSNPYLIPEPVRLNNRLFFERHKIEAYKRKLIGVEEKEFADPPIIELIPAAEVARELGHTRRTLGRRLVERKAEAH
jgi:hypothetical protein